MSVSHATQKHTFWILFRQSPGKKDAQIANLFDEYMYKFICSLENLFSVKMGKKSRRDAETTKNKILCENKMTEDNG